MEVRIRKTGIYFEARTLPNGFTAAEFKAFKEGELIKADKIIPRSDGFLVLLSGGEPSEDLVTTQIPLDACGMIS